MSLLFFVRWIHLVAAATWTGGIIVLGALVPALRRAGADSDQLQAAARRFGRISWIAMAAAVASGLGQVVLKRWPWSYGRLHLKLALVAVTVAIALMHQVTARRSSPAARGAIQLLLLLSSLGVFAAAVAL